MAQRKVALDGSSATIGDVELINRSTGQAAFINNGQSVDAASGGSTVWVAGANLGYNGATWDRVRVGDGIARTHSLASVANLTNMTVWTPAAGKRFRMTSIVLAATVAGHYSINDGSPGTVFYDVFLQANVSLVIALQGNGYLSLAANNVLSIENQSGAAATIYATAFGTEE